MNHILTGDNQQETILVNTRDGQIFNNFNKK